MTKKISGLFLSLFLLTSFCSVINTSDERITSGAYIMESLFDTYERGAFLVKYRKDRQFIGVLLFDEKHVGHTIQVFDAHTAEKVFEYPDRTTKAGRERRTMKTGKKTEQERQLVNFDFKKNAIIIYYKSTLWEEKIAFDLYSGKVVRRYSSWFGY